MSDALRNRTRNAVLMRDDVGRARKTVYDLPGDSHVFGRAEVPDAEGAREVTMMWAAHVPRPRSCPNQRDFVTINKKAAMSRVATSKDLAQFTRNNDIRMKPAEPSALFPKIIPSDVHAGFAYGIKSRPSTPINAVMNGDYETAENARLDTLYNQRIDAAEAGQRKHKVQMTKAAKAQIGNARAAKAAAAAAVQAPPPFKMNKFKNVGSKLSMARSASSPAL